MAKFKGQVVAYPEYIMDPKGTDHIVVPVLSLSGPKIISNIALDIIDQQIQPNPIKPAFTLNTRTHQNHMGPSTDIQVHTWWNFDKFQINVISPSRIH